MSSLINFIFRFKLPSGSITDIIRCFGRARSWKGLALCALSEAMFSWCIMTFWIRPSSLIASVYNSNLNSYTEIGPSLLSSLSDFLAKMGCVKYWLFFDLVVKNFFFINFDRYVTN